MTNTDLSRLTSDRSGGRRARFFTVVAVLLALASLAAVMAARAGAVGDAEELIRFGSWGEGAGQVNLSEGVGVATDPVTGHVYVVEGSPNYRVDEFTAWGGFVKAFGWDVAPGPVSEQQEVRVRAVTGQFRLTFGGSTTPDLAFGAPGAASEGPGSVEAALDALPSIGGVGGSVSVEVVPGTPDGAIPYVYVFVFKGSLAAMNVEQISATTGSTVLSGGVPSTVLEARTRADGTAGGTGLESCTTESGCKAGLEGGGAGEFSRESPTMAVDAAGNIYVRETPNNLRVQKFDSAGRFLLMFGGEVDKTTKADICTEVDLEGGDECGVGTPGSGQGQFGAGFARGIALSPGGVLFVGDRERIQRFNLQGEYESQVPVPGESETINHLAFDPVSGDLYVTRDQTSIVEKLDSVTGKRVGELEEGQNGLATDSAGNVFTIGSHVPNPVLEFDAKGKRISEFAAGERLPPPSSLLFFRIGGLGTNAIGDVYVANVSTDLPGSFIRAFGPGPASFEAPPQVAPTIGAQFAGSVWFDGATVAADINPHFWTNTRFFVQYGTGRCSEGGCGVQAPVSPGSILTSRVSGLPLQSAGVILEGLTAGTTYHYRFVAQSGGGGPVYGVDPDGTGPEEASFAEGGEATFTTFAPLPSKLCANDVFRSGAGALLPDCRAYEMVSPVDKNNGDVKALNDTFGYTTSLYQSSAGGERFTYSSYRSFGDTESAPFANQYIAARDPEKGWSSEALAPSQRAAAGASLDVGGVFEREYDAFSADLCSSWLVVPDAPPLMAGVSEGYKDLYRRDDCGGGGYQALIGVKPTVKPALFEPEFQGASADGKQAVLRVKDKLTEDATSGVWQAYLASNGGLHLLCILPDGLPSGGNCSGGTGGGDVGPDSSHRIASVAHAISADGSRVYWTDSAGQETGPGKIYLRENPDREQSALSGEECLEGEKACTVKVSGTESPKPSRFFGASADGSKALFEVTEGTLASDLYEFEAGAGSTQMAGKVLGVAGASEDLSYVYFVSEEALPATVGATAGRPNLYLDREGVETFIATLSKTDVEGKTAVGGGIPSDAALEPTLQAARASADGPALVFISTESLTGYDNTDQITGQPDSEVYVYEAGAAGPVCVSCDPSGARPRGRVVKSFINGLPVLATGGSVPAPLSDLYSPRALSSDGQRLFFNGYDALLPRDTNGKEDVYEWERSLSQKECEGKGAELYVASAGGCLSLISSGEGAQDSEFVDASTNGDDAFFTTNESLLSQDPGLIDVYDARVNGGFAQPFVPAVCEGEACQNPPVPPLDGTPGSLTFSGAGNLIGQSPAIPVKPRAKVSGRAQKLAAALRACAKKPARRRARCRALARKQYAAKRAGKATGKAGSTKSNGRTPR